MWHSHRQCVRNLQTNSKAPIFTHKQAYSSENRVEVNIINLKFSHYNGGLRLTCWKLPNKQNRSKEEMKSGKSEVPLATATTPTKP